MAMPSSGIAALTSSRVGSEGGAGEPAREPEGVPEGVPSRGEPGWDLRRNFWDERARELSVSLPDP